MCITLGKGWCSDDSQSAYEEGLIECRGGGRKRKDALLVVNFCFDSVHHFNVPFF